MIQMIKKESDEVVEPKKRQVYEEECRANELATEFQEMEIQCENDLVKANPILEEA